ncbi:MAG: diguanylate cyclase [Eubacterium sp.]|nr:diguanylate cyclase [Eubacterium sp.]
MKKGSIKKSIKFPIFVVAIVFTVVTVTVMSIGLRTAGYKAVTAVMEDRLYSDINYVENILAEDFVQDEEDTEVQWEVKDGSIYYGSVEIGDGTDEKAYITPFLQLEDKTGTFSYVFIKTDNDEELGYVEATRTQEGYEQGHYLRVAGSTKNPNGDSIVGTYMEKSIADALDENGVYVGEANVDGGIIFCVYQTLCDADGNVVGAIVVGRGIMEVEDIITTSISISSVIILVTIALMIINLLLFLGKWTAFLERVNKYLKHIGTGFIPDKPLEVSGYNEMEELCVSVNTMVDSLKENDILKQKAQQDAMTGAANRAGLAEKSEIFYDECYNEHKTFGVAITDIDGFKEYNDNYGHMMGDECIKKVVEVLQSVTGENVFLARYGGDEFTMLYKGLNRDEIEESTKEIRARLEEYKIIHEYSPVSDHITISQGICVGIPKNDVTYVDFLHHADQALYQAKKGGKNGYRIVSIE